MKPTINILSLNNILTDSTVSEIVVGILVGDDKKGWIVSVNLKRC